MRDTLIRSLFTVIHVYGLVHCSWKQRLNASKVGYKIGIWRNCCHMIMKNENWEWRVSPNTIVRFFFNFCIADPISVKLRNRAVTRTDITMSGVTGLTGRFMRPRCSAYLTQSTGFRFSVVDELGRGEMSTALRKRG